MNFDNKVIVFGRNSTNILGLIRSLGEKGIHPIVVMTGPKDRPASYSKYPQEYHFFDSIKEGYDYIVREWSHEVDKPIILCSGDMGEMMIDNNAKELKLHFIISASNENGKLTKLMSKQNICAYATKFGLNTPKMLVIKKGDPIPKDLEYPVFTKALEMIDGRKKDEHKCDNIEALQKAIDMSRQDGLLVQQFIEKVDEIDYIGYSANGEIYIPYIQHQLRFSDDAYGGYFRFDKLEQNDLVSKVTNMLKSIHFDGLFSVEFLVDKKGEWYFTEVNFRHDGHDYLTTSAGINLPWLYCCAMTGKDVELKPKVKKKSFTGMNELVDIEQFVSTRKISKAKWVWQFLTADTHILWNRRDMSPATYLIKKALNKITKIR